MTKSITQYCFCHSFYAEITKKHWDSKRLAALSLILKMPAERSRVEAGSRHMADDKEILQQHKKALSRNIQEEASFNNSFWKYIYSLMEQATITLRLFGMQIKKENPAVYTDAVTVLILSAGRKETVRDIKTAAAEKEKLYVFS